ncbi:MAG: c-type cytochrome domain-containing protein [Gemmatales bacterium]|nr:NB-ARC domain protein [Gemmatales bacterium]MDW7995194.1 c-type cytochrome domain-containing protein [Gemmatales bacterium]
MIRYRHLASAALPGQGRPVLLAFVFLAWQLGPLAGQEANVEPIKVITLNRKEPISFEKDIYPILEDKCLSCHAGPVKSGGYDMSTYEGLIKGGKRGPAVQPGRPNDSLLVQLAGRTKQPVMPPVKKGGKDDPLTPEQLALIRLWIEQGARGPSVAITRKREFKLGPIPAGVRPIGALAISPDKSTLVASRGSEIHVYDAATGQFIRALVNPELKDDKGQPMNIAHLDLVQALAYSPDGRFVASGGFQEVILWDVQTGQMRQRFTGFSDRVTALDFSRDGKYLATGGGAPTEEGELRILELPSGKVVFEKRDAHSDTIFGVRFSPDGKLLASGGADKFVKVWEVPAGKFVKSFEGHTHHVMDVGWKGDGKLLASCGADNTVKIWDYEKGEQVRTINAHGKQATRMAFWGNGTQFITISGEGQAKMWNMDNGGQIRTFAAGNDFLYAVAVSPDGALVAVGGQDSIIRIFNGQNGQLIKELRPPEQLASQPAK